jgi:hypothetical protein
MRMENKKVEIQREARARRYSSMNENPEYPRGVWYGSQGPQRSVIGRTLRSDTGEAELSSRLVSFPFTLSPVLVELARDLEVMRKELI